MPGMASRYEDELWESVPERHHGPGRRAADWVAALEPARHALDLGCGDGSGRPRIPAERLTLADVSAVALSRARTRLPDAEAVELEPDAPLPFDDNVFDLVVCTETLEHVRDVQLLLSEARRVLEPRGRLAVTTPAHRRLMRVPTRSRPTSASSRRAACSALLDSMGFDIRDVRQARRRAVRCRVPLERGRCAFLIDTSFSARGPSGTAVYIERLCAALHNRGDVEVVEARRGFRPAPGRTRGARWGALERAQRRARRGLAAGGASAPRSPRRRGRDPPSASGVDVACAVRPGDHRARPCVRAPPGGLRPRLADPRAPPAPRGRAPRGGGGLRLEGGRRGRRRAFWARTPRRSSWRRTVQARICRRRPPTPGRGIFSTSATASRASACPLCSTPTGATRRAGPTPCPWCSRETPPRWRTG